MAPPRRSQLALWIRSASRQLMREINESVVLGLIRQNGPISRVAIARTSHLSAATVTGITTRLIAQGLVSEKSQGASTGGRRPILLSFNSRAGIAIGFKITERELVCVATDLSAEQEQHSRITLPDHATPEDVIALIASEVDRAQGAATSRRLVGVGVGIAGVVDRPSGVCRLSPFLRWTDVPLRAALEDAVSVPVVVENDVNTLTFAVRGEVISTDRNSFIVVTVGRGIGLGMMLNGMPFRGARGQGGEFGHITVDPSGPTCECGKQGCLEATLLSALTGGARWINRDVAEFSALPACPSERHAIEHHAQTDAPAHRNHNERVPIGRNDFSSYGKGQRVHIVFDDDGNRDGVFQGCPKWNIRPTQKWRKPADPGRSIDHTRDANSDADQPA